MGVFFNSGILSLSWIQRFWSTRKPKYYSNVVSLQFYDVLRWKGMPTFTRTFYSFYDLPLVFLMISIEGHLCRPKTCCEGESMERHQLTEREQVMGVGIGIMRFLVGTSTVKGRTHLFFHLRFWLAVCSFI